LDRCGSEDSESAKTSFGQKPIVFGKNLAFSDRQLPHHRLTFRFTESVHFDTTDSVLNTFLKVEYDVGGAVFLAIKNEFRTALVFDFEVEISEVAILALQSLQPLIQRIKIQGLARLHPYGLLNLSLGKN